MYESLMNAVLLLMVVMMEVGGWAYLLFVVCVFNVNCFPHEKIRQVALGGHYLCLAASQQRIFATSWHYLSKNSGRLRNYETSQLRDFGSLEYINTLSATSKHRIFVTSALQNY